MANVTKVTKNTSRFYLFKLHICIWFRVLTVRVGSLIKPDFRVGRRVQNDPEISGIIG